MWTEPTDKIKDFFEKNNHNIKKYITVYDKETGIKRWEITTYDKKVYIFTQDFDFNFFKKNNIKK